MVVVTWSLFFLFSPFFFVFPEKGAALPVFLFNKHRLSLISSNIAFIIQNAHMYLIEFTFCIWSTKSSFTFRGILILNPAKKDMQRTSTKFWLAQYEKSQSLSTACPPKQILGNTWTHSVQHTCSRAWNTSGLHQSQKLCRRVSASEYQLKVSFLWMKSSLKVKRQHYYIWHEQAIHIERFLVRFLPFSCVTSTFFILFLRIHFN